MPLVLETASIVVVGRFNPYIFSPDWLIGEGLIPKKSEIHLELGAVSEGIRLRSKNSEWQVDYSGLIITSITEAGILAERVLQLLPHTPVSAIGSNFTYLSEVWESNLVPMLGTKKREDFTDPKSEIVKWTSVFHLETTRISMEVASGSEGLTVNFNHHQTVTSASEAACAAAKFGDNERNSTMLINKVLNGEEK